MAAISLVSVRPAREPQPQPEIAALRPSEYTAALIQVLRERAAFVRGADVLELGSGSGVVLAAAAAMGAASVSGVDIEPSAVEATAMLLHGMGHGEKLDMRQGDLWRPLEGRRFDVIASNLPQFPMDSIGHSERLPSWSAGGHDGRRQLDRVLQGLSAHLAPGGRAILTHNGFIGLDATREMLAVDGLGMRVALTVLVHLGREKLDLMNGGVLCAEDGRSIHRYGPYAFGEMHVVEIGAEIGDA